MAKTGIFGGAFDPLHNSHIEMALKALETGLDKVVFVPSCIPPHKSCNVSFEDRIEMLKRVISDYPRFDICTLEYDLGGVNYAKDVLPRLKEIYGDIVYIIGGDSLIDLDNPNKSLLPRLFWYFPVLTEKKSSVARSYSGEKKARISPWRNICPRRSARRA